MGKVDLSKVAKNVKATLGKHSPEILTGIGIAGMISTTVLAVKATPKALMLIEEEKRIRNYENAKEARDLGYDTCEHIDTLPPVDVVKTVWKCYIPAAVTGVSSIACLIGASSVHARRNAALATAYTLSESALREYKDKVIETIGEKKEKIVRDGIAKDRVDEKLAENPTPVIVETGKGTTRCYDHHAGRFFYSDMDQLKKITNEVNEKLIKDGYISLNEFYYAVGLDSTEIGRRLGWRVDQGLLELDFSAILDSQGNPCIAIDFNILPQYDFDKWL